VVKDVVTRYWTQKGKRIDRVRGWDCHGIYVEQKVQEKLGYTSNTDIEAKGIGGFIDGCYAYTKDISDQREWYVDHIGRWVDFKNAYKTMDNDYMESVLWVFKSLRDKGLVYKGKRVSLYSTKLNTPISNYEVALDNSYADVSDPAVTVKFPIIGGKEELGHFAKTADGFVDYAFAIIKDAQGRYLALYNTKRDDRQFAGGKIDAGEDPRDALRREIREELGVESEVTCDCGIVKRVTDMYPWRAHIYEVTLLGEPTIVETQKHSQLSWVEVIESDANPLGYAYRVENNIIDQYEEVVRFFDLYMAHHLLPKLSPHGEITQNAPMSLLAWTTTPWTLPANMALVVNPEMRYIQLYDIAAQQYYILAENLVSKYYKDPAEYLVIYRCRGRELL
jgi:8-oxo-dGTP pyrophosphatase MutT (NUDIX family)